MKEQIRIGILGYGNLGKGVECAVKQNPDMKLSAVFTRRAPETLKILTEGVPVYPAAEAAAHADEVDVLILCGGSATDLPTQTPEMAKYFNVVDSFDTHAKIPEHFANVDVAAKMSGKVGIISCGWDPGMFSLNRVYASAVLPSGKDYTFWGKGVSQGHSDAVRRIEGVVDARQYTIPVEEALDYWAQSGVLKGEKEVKTAAAEPNKRVVAKSARPSRGDVARRGLEDKNLSMLLSEAQLKFGRNLKTNESAGLVWIYDDLGLDTSVVLLLLQYALSEERLNITFLEKTAAKWVEMGIDSVLKAEKFISDQASKKLSWRCVERAFGIEHRKPSEKETELAALWLTEWKLTEEILIAAYDECVNQKSKFNMNYTAKILENWHKEGVKTAADIKKQEKPQEKSKKRSFAAYDIELYKQKLKSDD